MFELIFYERGKGEAIILRRDTLREIDLITHDYEDSSNMIATFNEIYGKDINFTKVYIKHTFKDKEKEPKYIYDVVYSKDNIDKDKIRDTLEEHLSANPGDVSKFSIRYVRKNLPDYKDPRELIYAYLKSEEYSRYRNLYFELKENNLIGKESKGKRK